MALSHGIGAMVQVMVLKIVYILQETLVPRESVRRKIENSGLGIRLDDLLLLTCEINEATC